MESGIIGVAPNEILELLLIDKAKATEELGLSEGELTDILAQIEPAADAVREELEVSLSKENEIALAIAHHFTQRQHWEKWASTAADDHANQLV